MFQIADALGVCERTVSRALHRKYGASQPITLMPLTYPKGGDTVGIKDYNLIMNALELLGIDGYDILDAEQIAQIQAKVANKYAEANMRREPWGSHENT